MIVVLFLVNLLGWIALLTLGSFAVFAILIWIGEKIITHKAHEAMKSDDPGSR